jgi:hypothetical protein
MFDAPIDIVLDPALPETVEGESPEPWQLTRREFQYHAKSAQNDDGRNV